MLLSSIALEELALAHIMNAEAEKLQFALGTLDTGVTLSPAEVSLGDLLDVNASVQRTLRDVIKKEMLLEFKFDNVLDLIGIILPPVFQVFDFSFTGAVQEFVVPNNVSRIRIEVCGAQGGPDRFPGGLGGYAVGETESLQVRDCLFLLAAVSLNVWLELGEALMAAEMLEHLVVVEAAAAHQM